MKLRPHEIAMRDKRREIRAIAAGRHSVRRYRRSVAVYEIHMRSLFNTFQQRMRGRARGRQPVPAHMRHRQPGGRIEGAAGSLDQPKKRRIPLL